jgi:hypothetical protein
VAFLSIAYVVLAIPSGKKPIATVPAYKGGAQDSSSAVPRKPDEASPLYLWHNQNRPQGNNDCYLGETVQAPLGKTSSEGWGAYAS